MTKTKITIAGIGGVGGFFGGLLAKHFYDHSRIDISFVARGEHLNAIQTRGLQVITPHSEFIARPARVTDDPKEIGIVDFIFLCTKSYSLEPILQSLKPCIDQNTILLPLLNGVDHREKIETFFPENIVLDGCVYIVSRLKEPGVVENSGNIQSLYFGRDHLKHERLNFLNDRLNEAGIEAFLSEDISTIIWEKYIFISSIATATSYYNECIGKILDHPEWAHTLNELVREVTLLAHVKNQTVASDIEEKTMRKLKALPYESTSSMHSDFMRNPSQTELETLTGYVVSESRKHHLQAPVYTRIYNHLKNRQ